MSKLEDQLDALERVRQRGGLTDELYASRRAAIVRDLSNLRTSPAQRPTSGPRVFIRTGCLSCMSLLAVLGGFVVLTPLIAALFIGTEWAKREIGWTHDDPGLTAYVVGVDGTAGLQVSGTFGTAGDRRAIRGGVPQRFTARSFYADRRFTVMVGKMTAGVGTLIVTVRCADGDHMDQTSDAFGEATVNCDPQ